MLTSILLFATGVFCQAQEEEAKAKIRDFQKKTQKAGVKDEEVEAALHDLATVRHPLVLKELVSWVKKPYRPVRKKSGGGGGFEMEETGIKLNHVAASCIADNYEGDPNAAKGLLEAVKARDAERPKARSMEEEDLVSDLAHFVECFGKVRCRPAAKDLVPLFRHRYAGVCEAAFEAAADLRSKDLIEPLIQVLAEAEKMKPAPAKDRGAGAEFGTAEPDRKDVLADGARRALEATTGERKKDSAEWKKWWEANRQTFKERE
ncbi:MAG: hypothetical protein HYY17_10965 [Planctomycetes bacterium]|nr:hypothetical protein [Planctomycetota bacterium]